MPTYEIKYLATTSTTETWKVQVEAENEDEAINVSDYGESADARVSKDTLDYDEEWAPEEPDIEIDSIKIVEGHDVQTRGVPRDHPQLFEAGV